MRLFSSLFGFYFCSSFVGSLLVFSAASHDGGRRRRPRRHLVHTLAPTTALGAVHPFFAEQQKNMPDFKLRFGTYRHSAESWPLRRHLHFPLSTVPAA
ncbi:hypothetical protein J1605_012746 [Eschrichtius robustus]|uniref:Secreted protein n=1 Tax=Eschrichtius robustus TaxID=9764 RepID=A0AB34GLK2_ESCRO|nr:hypothetical protein J1605_012746 [Eschrichtius robustus]